MQTDEEQLKSFLLDTALVSAGDIAKAEAAAKNSGRGLEAELLSSGRIAADDLRRAQAYVLGIPFVDLKKTKVDRETLALVPEPVARRHNIVAFQRSQRGLEVAMLDPEDLKAIEFIRKSVGGKILPRLTDTESIKNVLVQYRRSLQTEFGGIVEAEAAKLKTLAEKAGEEINEAGLKKLAEDLPVVRVVDSLVSHAILQRASDIHLEPFEEELVVRYRIDGVLHEVMHLPRESAPGLVARIKILTNLRLDEKRLPQDGRFKAESSGERVSLRVSILPTFFGEKVVMRLLPESGGALTLEEAGFHGELLENVHSAMRQKTGMILVTGPTGCGKTTTLYTVLEILNTPEVNISTIEDPVEYQIPRINQSQVRPEIGFSFGNGLRALLRQDPDIIMVGEIRDRETAGLAVNAALTGHLVLSTLHTNSASGAMPRLLDMGVEPFLLVSTLNIVVAQRLVRRLTRAREKFFLSAAEIKKLGESINLDRMLEILRREGAAGEKTGWEEVDFCRPKPGEDSEDGYQGRVGIFEALKMSPAIKNLVMEGATADRLEEQGKKEGMITMIEDGVLKAARGFTTLEEVFRVVTNE